MGVNQFGLEHAPLCAPVGNCVPSAPHPRAPIIGRGRGCIGMGSPSRGAGVDGGGMEKNRYVRGKLRNIPQPPFGTDDFFPYLLGKPPFDYGGQIAAGNDKGLDVPSHNRASVMSRVICRIKSFQFYSRFLRGKLPVNSGILVVAMILPRFGL